ARVGPSGLYEGPDRAAIAFLEDPDALEREGGGVEALGLHRAPCHRPSRRQAGRRWVMARTAKIKVFTATKVASASNQSVVSTVAGNRMPKTTTRQAPTRSVGT